VAGIGICYEPLCLNILWWPQFVVEMFCGKGNSLIPLFSSCRDIQGKADIIAGNKIAAAVYC